MRVHTRACVCVSHVLVTCFTSHGHHPGWSSYRTGYYSQACTCVLDEPGVCPGSCRYNIRIVTPWNPVKTSLPGHILRIPRYTAANNVEMRYEGEKCRIGRHGAPDPLRGYSKPVQRSPRSWLVIPTRKSYPGRRYLSMISVGVNAGRSGPGVAPRPSGFLDEGDHLALGSSDDRPDLDQRLGASGTIEDVDDVSLVERTLASDSPVTTNLDPREPWRSLHAFDCTPPCAGRRGGPLHPVVPIGGSKLFPMGGPLEKHEFHPRQDHPRICHVCGRHENSMIHLVVPKRIGR